MYSVKKRTAFDGGVNWDTDGEKWDTVSHFSPDEMFEPHGYPYIYQNRKRSGSSCACCPNASLAYNTNMT